MTLTVEPTVRSVGVDSADGQMVRYGYVKKREDYGPEEYLADSSDFVIGQTTTCQRSRGGEGQCA